MKKLLPLILLTLLFAACSPAEESAAETPEPITLRLMTHDSFDIGQETIDQFTAETGYGLEIFKAGDAGEVVNKAVLAKDNPLADVLFGVDNTFLSRALENDIFLPYESPVLEQVDDSLQLDPQHRALPVDFGDVCLNYDKAWFEQQAIDPPSSLDDLVDPAYAGLTVVENPATSSPGLAFLLTTIANYGEEGYLDYWQQLRDNDVEVTDGWESAYYGSFTAASDGDRPIVVSYASSPAAEVYFAEEALDEAPTAAVITPGSCFRQIEFAGILAGTEHEAAAQKLVDFLLYPIFQENIPLHMFVYPANGDAELPELFVEYSQLPEMTAGLPPEEIGANREQWIQDWTRTVINP